MSQPIKIGIILFIALAGIAATFALPPISQDQGYFLFADRRSLWGIPNAADVVSNIPFLFVGILGLLALRKHWQDKTRFIQVQEAIPFLVAFLGLILLAPCSAYFHWTPTNDTQAWDRLPMTLVFMAFFSIIIGERIHFKTGLTLLPILLAAGIGSVVYWSVTESHGQGDLRPYALVQFLPILMIPAMLLLFKPRYTGGRHLAILIVWYGLAKVFELLDVWVFTFTHHLVSGHTLKHLVAAIGIFGLVKYIQVRQKI